MAIDTSAPRQQQASRRLGQGSSAAGSAACPKRVARLARSAQIARRADPPGPLFHRAIWPAMGSRAEAGAVTAAGTGTGSVTGQVTGAGTGTASVMGAGSGAGMTPRGGKPGDGGDAGTGEGEKRGKGPDPGAAGGGRRRGKGPGPGAAGGGRRRGKGPGPGAAGGGRRRGKGPGSGTGAGTGAVGQDSCRARRGDGGALSWGTAGFGGGLAQLAVAVPGGAADRAAAPRRCFPPSNESPSCPAAGLLVPRRR